MICGFKIEISGYPLKVLIITYSPYKYEVNRTKTHEMRAKCFRGLFFPHCTKGYVYSQFCSKEKNRQGRRHDYAVWRQNKVSNCERLSISTHLKLHIRPSYLPSTPTICMKLLQIRRRTLGFLPNAPANFQQLSFFRRTSCR